MAQGELQILDDVQVFVIDASEFADAVRLGILLGGDGFDFDARCGKEVRSQMQSAKSQIKKTDVGFELGVKAV